MAAVIYPTTSRNFACNTCGAPVALLSINPDDLAYVCQNPACGRAVSVDCPQALAVLEPLELAERISIAALVH